MTADLLAKNSVAALLFDMDGTLLNSIAAAERVWARWAEGHGLDVERFLPTIHGKRVIDTIAGLNLPGVDAAAEAAAITRAEIAEVEGVFEIPGAAAFLKRLPANSWAVVTSAPRQLACVRLKAAGLPVPPLLICAEDVQRGKPHPEGYLLAAQRLGVAIRDCVIFEDAEVGIAAAKTAGATLVVVTATHGLHRPAGAADQISVPDYIACADPLLAALRG